MSSDTHEDEETGEGPLRSFDLVFPVDLSPKQVLAWAHSLGGLLVSGPGRLFGVRHVVLELCATGKGLGYQLIVPKGHAGYVADQLRTHLPGIRVTPSGEEPARDEPSRSWTLAGEYGMRHHLQTLHVPDPVAPSTSLLASLRQVGADEACLLQWVLTPALRERAPAPQRSSGGSAMRLLGGMQVQGPRGTAREGCGARPA